MTDYDDIVELSGPELATRAAGLMGSLRDLDLTVDEQAELSARVSANRDQVAGLLTDNISRYRTALAALQIGRTRMWNLSLAMLAIGSTALVLWLIGVVHPSWVARATLSVALVVLVSSPFPTAWNESRRRSGRRAAQDVLSAAIDREVRLRVNQFATEMQTLERRWSNSFSSVDAPALVELDVADTAPSTTLERVRAFILEHDASTIGIAGPRGSGKSTLARQILSDSIVTVGVDVSAPVTYEPNEFTRVIHGRLARKISGRTSSPLPAPERQRFKNAIPVIIALLAGVAFVVAFILDLNATDSANRELAETLVNGSAFDPAQLAGMRLDWVGILGVAGVGIVLGYLAVRAWFAFRDRSRLSVYATNPAQLGSNALDFLAWSTTIERSSKTKLAGDGVAFEGTNKLSRTQRELTHAESVQLLREFLQELVAMLNKRRRPDERRAKVIVCIDELDKVAKPSQAIATINGLKDLFHIDGVHFLLSVSTDALARFAARGVPIRDAFDSSFDTIIRMTPLTRDESRKLISQRARGFSSTAALFCYAWSGGNARDLIRTARACVAFRQSAIKDDPTLDPSLAEVVSSVMRAQVRELIDAMTSNALDRTSSEALSALLDIHRQLGDPAVSIDKARTAHKPSHAIAFRAQGKSEEVMPASAFGHYLEIAALTERLFSINRRPDQWQSTQVKHAVDALALARASLGRHPGEARRLVDEAAGACVAAQVVDVPLQKNVVD